MEGNKNEEADIDQYLKVQELLLKQKEVQNFGKESDVDKLRVLKEVLESFVISTNEIGTVYYESPLSAKSRETVAKKIIEIVNRL